jgi:hypothetical protein
MRGAVHDGRHCSGRAAGHQGQKSRSANEEAGSAGFFVLS